MADANKKFKQTDRASATQTRFLTVSV